MLPPAIFHRLPVLVRNQLSKLSAEQQEKWLEEYLQKEKSIGVAYLLWFFGGWHYLYLRKWGTQILFTLTSGGLLIWWLVDLFRTAGMVRDYNKDVAMDVFRLLPFVSYFDNAEDHVVERNQELPYFKFKKRPLLKFFISLVQFAGAVILGSGGIYFLSNGPFGKDYRGILASVVMLIGLVLFLWAGFKTIGSDRNTFYYCVYCGDLVGCPPWCGWPPPTVWRNIKEAGSQCIHCGYPKKRN